MTCNREGGRFGEHEARGRSPAANEPVRLSEALSVLSHRNNRRILLRLLQQDEPISVEALTAHVAAESTSLPTEVTVRTEQRDVGDTRS